MNAPNTLSAGNYVSISPVYPIGGADDAFVSLDLLRTSTPTQPTGTGNYAVATVVSAGLITDQSNTLSSYTVAAGIIGANFAITCENEVVGSGSSHLICRQNGVFVVDLFLGSSGGGIADIATTLPITGGPCTGPTCTIGINPATTSALGSIELTNDLGGTGASPTVVNGSHITNASLPLSGMLTGADNTLLGYSATGVPSGVTVGTGLSLSSGVLTATGGGGGVSGSGTAGFLSEWSTPTALTNSPIKDAAGQLNSSEELFINTSGIPALPANTPALSLFSSFTNSGACPLVGTNTFLSDPQCFTEVVSLNPNANAHGVAAPGFFDNEALSALSNAPSLAGVYGRTDFEAGGSPLFVTGVVGYGNAVGTSGTIANVTGVTGIAQSQGSANATVLAGIDGQVQNQSGGNTQPFGAALYARSPAFASGSPITNIYGLYIADQTGGGSNNPNPQGIYEAGAAPNTLNGLLTVAGIVDSAITTSPNTSPICPNGTGGAFTTSGCSGGGGSGTVNSGTQWSPAFYATTGTAVSGTTPFTGLEYWSGSGAPAAASSANVQSVIGSGVYDASGAAATAQSNAETYASNASNLSSGTVAAARLPAPTASTLGGVESITSAANEWISYIDTSGVPHQSQPAFSNISGTPSTTQVPFQSLTTAGSGAASLALGVLNIPTPSSGGTPGGSLYALQTYASGPTFGGLNAPTTPPLVPQVTCSTPTSGSVATAYTNCVPGLLGRPVTGTTSTDTILATDCDPTRVEYVGSVSVAVTLPTATTLGVANCMTKLVNWTTGSGTTVTVTPTTWTINGNATLVLAIGQEAILSIDPNSGTNWIADVVENGGIVAGTNVTLARTPNGGLTINAAGGSTRTWLFTYQGVCQAGVSSFSVNFPLTNSPNYVACTSTNITPEFQIPGGNTSDTFWVKLRVPAGVTGAYTLTTTYRSVATTGTATVQPTYACVAAGAVPDNPSFSNAGSTFTLTPAGTTLQNVTTTDTFTPTCAAGADLYVMYTLTANTISGSDFINFSYLSLAVQGSL